MDEIYNEENESIRVRVKLEPKDFFWFTMAYLWKSLSHFMIMSVLIFIIGIILSIGTKPTVGIIILFVPFLLIVFILLSTLYTGKQSAEKHGNRTYTVDQDGISFISEEMRASYKWETFVNILKTKSYIYLFITSNSALIFPLRSFYGEQLKTFNEYIPSEGQKKKNLTGSSKMNLITILLVFLVLIGIVSYFSGQ